MVGMSRVVGSERSVGSGRLSIRARRDCYATSCSLMSHRHGVRPTKQLNLAKKSSTREFSVEELQM